MPTIFKPLPWKGTQLTTCNVGKVRDAIETFILGSVGVFAACAAISPEAQQELTLFALPFFNPL